MELLYQVNQVERDASKRFHPSTKPVCAVSLRNLVAFTSYSDLSKKEDNELSFLQDEDTSGSNVYVADLNTPWECFLVKNHNCCIVHLNWDNTGVQLLIATEDGQVEVYGMLEDLLNKWKLIYSGQFAGEPILTSCWLSAPRLVCLIPDKQDNMLYSEKYHVSAIRRGKGMSKSLEGAVVVTATGLVGALIRSTEDTTKGLVGVEKVDPLRSHIQCADLAYSKEGYIALVTSGESLNKPIATCRIDVSIVGTARDKVEVKVGSLMSFYHKTPTIRDPSISSVKFLSKVNPLSLVVALKGQDNCALLSLYELTAQPLTMKPRFQSSAVPTNPLTIRVWQQIHQITFSSPIEEMCTLPSPISLPLASNQSQNMNQQLSNLATCTQPLIAVSLSNGNLHLVRSDCLQQVGLASANNGGESSLVSMKRERDEVVDAKQPRLTMGSPQQTNNGGSYFVSLQFTWSGCLLLTLDAKAQINLYKIHSNIDASTATSLVELSMMGGLDPWDIFLCIRPNLIENITDRLSETFARQPPAIQSHYNTRILVLKAALHRLTCGSTSRTNDQQTLLTLHLVSGALKALLRPGSLSPPDRGPAESLSNLLSTKGEALSDVDKVLPFLEAKQYAVEAPLLQSLQQFLQWCADLSLKLLAILPDLRHSRAPGWEVCRDSKAIATLRELIVLMRIWGLIRPACLPSFRKTSDSLDVLPLLFRLLTKLSVTPHDPDEALIDECCLLPSEVQMPNINAFYPSKNHGVASTAMFARNSPLQFEFGVNPSKWLNHLDGQKSGGYWMDGLRLLWLGRNPTGVKACNRCGCSTLIQATPRSSANKAWDNRWIRTCPCGGNWKIPASLPQHKPVDTDAFLNF